MEKKLTYFDLAEEDYRFLQYDREAGRVGNLMCSAAQNICERYLKYVIDTYVTDTDTTRVLQTHSLKMLRRFLKNELPDFECDWKKVLQADGYYFSSRYPGEDAFLVEKEDVDECWEAVEETRTAVLEYLKTRDKEGQTEEIGEPARSR